MTFQTNRQAASFSRLASKRLPRSEGPRTLRSEKAKQRPARYSGRAHSKATPTMERQEWQFTTPAPEKQLYAVSYTGKEPKAVLFFHHGINEHIGRYAECALRSRCGRFKNLMTHHRWSSVAWQRGCAAILPESTTVQLGCCARQARQSLTAVVLAVFPGLVQQGIDCHSYDARSFGRSETNNAERGKIENFEHLVIDYLAFIDKIEQGDSSVLCLRTHVSHTH